MTTRSTMIYPQWNTKTVTQIASIASVMMLHGCAIHFDVKEPAVPTGEVESFTIGTSVSDLRLIRSRQLASGGVLVGLASDKADRDSTIAFVLGAVAGGVTGLPVAQSIELQASAESAEMLRLPHSNEFGQATAVNVPLIFADVVKERSGISHAVQVSPPESGVYIIPFAVLRSARDEKIHESCGFNVARIVAGKLQFSYQYWMHSNTEFSIAELPAFTSSRFQVDTERCFHTLLGVFDEHRSGKLNDRFESGTLMYYDDAGWRGMYFRDESRQAYLRYTPSFMEVYPFRMTFSYQPAVSK